MELLAKIPAQENECKTTPSSATCRLCGKPDSESWTRNILGEPKNHVGLKEKTINGKAYGLICCDCFCEIQATKDKQLSRIKQRIDARKNLIVNLAERGIKQRFLNCSFSNFQFHGGQSKKTFSLETTDNLFIWGKQVGCGKTHLACAIARDEMWHGRTFRFVTATNLLLELRSSFSDSSLRDESDIIDRYVSPRLLIVDDIGSEKITDYVVQSWYSIIDLRYSEMKKTVYTSNLSLNEIADKFGDRIASRIASGRVVHITGKDMRIEGQYVRG